MAREYNPISIPLPFIALPVISREFPLARDYFAMQSHNMNSDQAHDTLITIRTLMERSSIYRRTLAPIMIFVGTLGIAGAVLGIVMRLERVNAFAALWLGIAITAVSGAFLIARYQAMRDKEEFWSAPTRRVSRALLLPLVCGAFFSLLILFRGAEHMRWLFVYPNIFFYGCAMHAAGFFMPPITRKLAWTFCALGAATLVILPMIAPKLDSQVDHAVMGFFFGVLHFAYGLYLILTNRQPKAA
jgi:hypothetical protein